MFGGAIEFDRNEVRRDIKEGDGKLEPQLRIHTMHAHAQLR